MVAPGKGICAGTAGDEVMPADRHRADPVPLFFAERGSGTPTITLVHGFGASHAAWDAIAADLSVTVRTLAVDLPGHGRSLASPGAGNAKASARAILSGLAVRGVESTHIVGHSMGGAVATLMALAEPGRVASLTLLAPGGFGEEIDGPLLRAYAAAADATALRACLAAMSGPDSPPAEDDIQACLAMRSHPGQAESLVAIAGAITRGDRQGVIPRELLASLPMPVTVLWGTADSVLPVLQAEGLPERFRILRLPRAGHMLAAEAPGAVLAAIRANLAP